MILGRRDSFEADGRHMSAPRNSSLKQVHSGSEERCFVYWPEPFHEIERVAKNPESAQKY